MLATMNRGRPSFWTPNMHSLADAMLYARTIARLRPIQIYDRVQRRFRSPLPALGPAPRLRTLSTPCIAPLPTRQTCFPGNEFRFLEVSRTLARAEDWNGDGERLWYYNLHYFSDLVSSTSRQRTDEQRTLIARWIAENPPAHGVGWEPYPLSRRVVNWIKWHLTVEPLGAPALQSLALQGRSLMRQLEYHLLGNHLLANAKALVFLGALFGDEEGDVWFSRGLGILDEELPEQILSDGGHFELSTKYQAIMAEDMLDLIWLARTAPPDIASRMPVEVWQDVAARMLRWQAVMSHPDGRIAHFNDAAAGDTRPVAELVDFAHRLAVPMGDLRIGDGIQALPQSGYFRLQRGDAVAIFDAAEVGPRYQPGHAHADTLCFELSLRGERVFVNRGTSTYEIGSPRNAERGTAAHNTVSVDGRDSSEVWASFRVARRASSDDVQYTEEPTGRLRIAAVHNGFRRIFGGPLHRRSLELSGDELIVRDLLEGGRWSSATAYFHLAPGLRAVVTPGDRSGTIVTPLGKLPWRVENARGRVVAGAYHPMLGSSVPIDVLAVDFEGPRSMFFLSLR